MKQIFMLISNPKIVILNKNFESKLNLENVFVVLYTWNVNDYIIMQNSLS